MKWILSLANSAGRLLRCLLGSGKYDYKLKLGPEAAHEVANGVSHLWRTEYEQSLLDEEVSCFITKGSPSGDAAPPGKC